LVGVLGLSATAAASEPGFYLGGGVGLYNIKIDRPLSIDCPIAGQTTNACARNFEDSAAVWDAFAGFQLTKWLGFQADYNWYGETEDQIPINSSVNTTVTGDAWEASVRLSLPLGDMFEVYGRGGYNWYNVDVKRQFSKGNSDSNDAVMYAGGIGLNFTPSFGINAEYEIVDIDNGDLDSATLRFKYTFVR